MAAQSPFERIGGAPAVAALVDAFYDLVEQDPAYAELRRMHAHDLAPMRRSLSGFLTGWMGGPRDWFDQHPGKCMVSVHAGLPITARTARQWVQAMREALRLQGVNAEVAAILGDIFENMATSMARLPA
jgi:hemoglobin